MNVINVIVINVTIVVIFNVTYTGYKLTASDFVYDVSMIDLYSLASTCVDSAR